MRLFSVQQLKTIGLSGAFLLAAIPVAAQQSTANLGGKVFDAQGKILQGATVDLTSQETGNQWHVTTNKGGSWLVESLVPGHYSFNVSNAGFKTSEHSAIELQVADQKYIDTTLDVGAVSETVVVSATTPLIDTTGAVSGTVITQAQLEEIPSYTNSPIALAALAPGATFGLTTGGAAHLWSNSSESELNVNNSGSGGGSYNVNYQIEGGTNSTGGGGIAFIPPMDSVGEFRVSTNAYDASIGRVTAATVDMQIKSGGRALHGTLYEMNQNNTLNAIPYANGPTTLVPPVHTNEFGGTVGGPIWVPKLFDGRNQHTFFFFSYDGIRSKSPGTTSVYMNLPTLAERNGDFSQSFITGSNLPNPKGANPIQVYDPSTVNTTTGLRQQFPGNIIPASRISPIAKALYALMPAPNNPNGNDGTSSDGSDFIRNEVKEDVFNSYIGRVDKAFNEKNHTYVEYRFNHLTETSGDPLGPTNILDSQQLLRTNWGLTADHAWVVSPNFLLDFHGNATWYQTANVELSYGIDPTNFGFSQAVAALATPASIPLITGVGSGWENSGFGTSEAPKYTKDALYEGRVTATQIVRNNSIKYGAEYLIQQEADNNLGSSQGSFSFGNNWTDQYAGSTVSSALSTSSLEDIAAFDLGIPTGGSVPTNASAFWSQPFMGLFVQDDWRVTSRFTLNLGLRWDYQEGLTERHNRFFSQFNPTANVAPVTAVAQPAYAADLAGTSAGAQFLQQYHPSVSSFVATGQVEYAGVNGVSRDVTQTSKKYFQPRIGFAYRIHPNTVIRGGLGRFVQANFLTGNGNQTGYSNSTPFDPSNDSYFTQASSLANPFPAGELPVVGNSLGGLIQPGSFTSFNQPRVPRTYVDEVSLHLEQQIQNWLFELGGSVNITRALGVGYNINVPSTQQWLAANTPSFASNGLPSSTLPGNVLVPNPFHGAPDIVGGLTTNTTIGAYQLALPDPLFNSLTETFFNATNDYYGMTARAEHRYRNGFGLLVTFAWAKDLYNGNLPQNQAVSQKLFRELSSGDVRFIYNINPTYVLPFGRGQFIGGHVNRLTDLAIGGWELSGIFTFNSGTPVGLPTNSAFFQGGDPGSGFVKTRQHWFDTSKFAPFPSSSTPVASLSNPSIYPAWTGVTSLPGANYVPPTLTSNPANGVYQDFATWRTRNPVYFGDVRNPPYVNQDLGLRKAFPIHEQTRLQLRFDAFNAFNHPVFSGPGTTAGGAGFGYLSNSPTTLNQNNNPRVIQFEGKIYF